MPPAKEETPNLTSPSRRVIKAKAPPPSLDLPKPASEANDDDVVEVDATHASYSLGSPSVKRELEQEQVEKWRKERLVGLAAKQKMERDEKVSERRQNSSTPTHVETTSTNNIAPEVLQGFSVEPKYPEHKRAGDSIAGISGGEPQGKRRKSSMDEGSSEKDTESGGPFSKVYVVSALVAAMAIGMAIFRRSKG